MFSVSTSETANYLPEAPILIPDGPWKQVRHCEFTICVLEDVDCFDLF